MSKTNPKDPIINCHSHVFTGDYVPPLLGKGVVPAAISWIPHLGAFNWIMRNIVMPIRNPEYGSFAYNTGELRRSTYEKYTHFPIIPRIAMFFQYALAIPTVIIILGWFGWTWTGSEGRLGKVISPVEVACGQILEKTWQQVAFVVLVLLFLKTARRFILFCLRYLLKMPGKLNTALFNRYLQMGEFAKYKQQFRIFSRISDQYPSNTRFVVLPMDMKYMKAGLLNPKPLEYSDEIKELAEGSKEIGKEWWDPYRLLSNKENYYLQMEKLRNLKGGKHGERIYPFVFLHPDRLREDQQIDSKKDKTVRRFFDYDVNSSGKVILKDCWLKRYMEPKPGDQKLKFAGFKIYPALGYYPFELELLPLWKYAVQEKIPIMTHCVVGTIFYRGMKKKEWNQHPLYYQKNDESSKLKLSATRARNYQRNFTHPMNFLCLLHPELFGKLLKGHLESNIPEDRKEELIKMFGNPTDGLTSDLRELKICFGHFGGQEEWAKYLDLDRENIASQLRVKPAYGNALAHTTTDENGDGGELSWYNARLAWEKMDWYSLLCSLMLQYPNVYADISYMLHHESIFPLLKQTLQHERGKPDHEPVHLTRVGLQLPSHRLGERVLFGTDFYMVRSHRTEKDILAQTQALLSEEEFDLIARENPKSYLNL